MKTIIGIDLGTSKCCAGVFIQDEVKLIENKKGNSSIPSYVTYDPKILIGEPSKAEQLSNPENTIFNTKRLIGREFDEVPSFPYKLTKECGRLKIKLRERNVSPEKITSKLLLKIKENADEFLKEDVSDAVVVVPACFDEVQRLAVRKAADEIGIKVNRFVNESTVAMLALDVLTSSRNILIFSMGAGFIDVSIAVCEDGINEVLASTGSAIGGLDFDNKLIDHFKEDFKNNFCKTFENNARSTMLLWNAAQNAKHALSSNLEANVNIPNLFEGIGYSASISRNKFEELCKDLMKAILPPVQKSIAKSGLNKNNLHEIVVMGGSTRIPKIRSILENYFIDKQLSYRSDLVVRGAATLAAIFGNSTNPIIYDMLLLDVTPLPLGIETAEGVMTTIVPYNTTIPILLSKKFTTYKDDQTTAMVQMYQGNDSMTKHNIYLDTYIVTGIPALPRGTPNLKIDFGLDANGAITVKIFCCIDEKKVDVVVVNEKDRLSRNVNEMLVVAAH